MHEILHSDCLLFRQSKIHNPKAAPQTKIGGACRPRSRLRRICGWGWGPAANENPRIGYLGAASHSANAARIEAFRQGLRELGYLERQNAIIEWRHAEGKLDRLRELMAELVRLKVDVIVTGGTDVTRVAKEATSTIPIVMTNDTDPVGNGFVAVWPVRAGTSLDCQLSAQS